MAANLISNGISPHLRSQSNSIPSGKILAGTLPDMLNWMIHMLYTKRDFGKCKELAEEELKRCNGYNEYANFILGKMLQEEGKIQEALKYFKMCLTLNPRNVENFKQIGRCLFLLGRYQLAIEMFLKAEKHADLPDWNIYHHLGVCYVKLKELEKAKEYIRRAVDLGKSEKSFITLAEIYETQRDFKNVIDTYQVALRLYPASTQVSINLGLIYMKLAEYKKAFNQLGTALAHDPTNAEALYTFAAEMQRHGEFDIAVSKYKIAALKLPESSELWNNVGMCFFGKRKYVAAITCLKRSYYLSPTNWLTLHNLGLLHLNTRQHASAAIYLSAAAKLNKHHAPTFTILALSLKHLSDSMNSKKCFEEALRLNENDIVARINFSQLLYSLNETEIALKHLHHFQQLTASSPQTVDKELIELAHRLEEALHRQNTLPELNSNSNVHEKLSDEDEPPPLNEDVFKQSKLNSDPEFDVDDDLV